ncbi:MAG: type II secretion system F family protein, partial [Granulosicoccaceae bacterium]
MPIELNAERDEHPASSTAGGLRGKSQKLKNRERSTFFERLALMLDAGTSLHSALESMLRSDYAPSTLRTIIEQIQKDVNNGSSFADALSKHPRLLSGVQLKLISAGEQGGFLPEVINKIVDFEDRQHKLRSSIVGALTYPAVLMLVSLLVCVFVLLVVFPQFKDMFSALEDELPLVSQLMFSLSNQLSENSVIAIPLVSLTLALGVHWLMSENGKTTIRAILFRIPYTRTMY